MGGGLGFEFLSVSGVGYKETGDAGVGRQTDGDPREFSDTARRLPAVIQQEGSLQGKVHSTTGSQRKTQGQWCLTKVVLHNF